MRPGLLLIFVAFAMSIMSIFANQFEQSQAERVLGLTYLSLAMIVVSIFGVSLGIWKEFADAKDGEQAKSIVNSVLSQSEENYEKLQELQSVLIDISKGVSETGDDATTQKLEAIAETISEIADDSSHIKLFGKVLSRTASDPSKTENASIRFAQIHGLDAQRSQIPSIDFSESMIGRANFKGSALHHANFREARIGDGNFHRASVAGNFTDAIISAPFVRAGFYECDFTHCIFDESSFRGADLSEIQFDRTTKFPSTFRIWRSLFFL